MDSASDLILYGHVFVGLLPMVWIILTQSYSVNDTIPLIPVRSPNTQQESHTSQFSRQSSDSSQAPLLHTRSTRYSEPNDTPKRRSPLSGLANRLPKGWRFGATLAVILSTIILFVNIAVTAVAYARMRRNGSASGIAPISVGSCDSLKHTSLLVHLAINVASSLLLSGSNFCMQCISAPTRRDIDKAHKNGKWLDIAVPSVRNIRSLGRKRLFLWISLGLSSIPLHLVYNSTFFLSTTNHSTYRLLFASESFTDGAPFSELFIGAHDDVITQYPNGTLYSHYAMTDLSRSASNPTAISSLQANSSHFQRLENADCISAYAKRILPERSNLILVTSTSPHDQDVFEPGFGNRCQTPNAEIIERPEFSKSYTSELMTQWAVCDSTSSLSSATVSSHSIHRSDPFAWICANGKISENDPDYPWEPCSSAYKTIRDNAANWTVSGFRVDYCLSEETESLCSFNAALSLLVVVIAFNLCKVGVIGYTLYAMEDKPLITIGDAVDSFLVQNDPFTSGKRLLSKDYVQSDNSLVTQKLVDPSTLKEDRARRWKSASKARWIVALTLTFIALVTILGLLALAISTLASFGSNSAQALWELGLGTIDPRALIAGWALPETGDGAAIASILVANLPQLILSFIYIIFNSIFTSMSLAVEWSQYAHKPRTLRVSQRRGEQRSTYFLQVPYRLGIPVMIFSMVLHWLISQSIFLAKIDDSLDSSSTVTTCGFSPVGMIFTFIAGVSLVIFAGVLGSMRLRPGMPLVGSCSLAISAACHAPEGTSEVRPLIWGPLLESRYENDPIVGPYGFYNETKI